MKNRTKAVTEYAEFPMRKLIVTMMAVAIATIFLTSFIMGPNVPLKVSINPMVNLVWIGSLSICQLLLLTWRTCRAQGGKTHEE